VVGAVAGDQLPYTPKLAGSATADYVFPLSPTVQGTFGATYRYQGAKPSSFSADEVNTYVMIPAYSAIDLRAGTIWDQYTLRLRVENLTNKRGIVSSFDDQVFAGQGVPAQTVIIQPRTYVLSLGIQF
jgi:iron complex outermembrane recepter protein